jgi:enamine deaminase RidA (YjgF/YER057c/UK114 family)
VIEQARAALVGDHKPADTLVGSRRRQVGCLIEVDAVAVLDA